MVTCVLPAGGHSGRLHLRRRLRRRGRSLRVELGRQMSVGRRSTVRPSAWARGGASAGTDHYLGGGVGMAMGRDREYRALGDVSRRLDGHDSASSSSSSSE